MNSTRDTAPTDDELMAFLEGRTDEALTAHIAAAIERDPDLEQRLAALDPGLPEVQRALGGLAAAAPVDHLARALAATVAEQAARSTADAALAPAPPATVSWGTLAVVSALTFAAGLWVGIEGRDRLSSWLEPPAMVDPSQPAVVDPSPPAITETPPPAITEAQPPAVAEAQPPAVAEAQPPAVAETPPPVVAEAQPPAVAEAQPPAVAETQPPAVAEARPPAVASEPIEPTTPPVIAEAVSRPAVTPWVEAVAGYVRLMTADTLTQTALSAPRQRAQLTRLSQTFGVDLRALVRSLPGLSLQRIEVLQFNGLPLLQLGFVGPDATPLVVCILLRPSTSATGSSSRQDPVFRTETPQGLQAVSWDLQPRGFLVIGRSMPDRLSDVARRVARAL